MGNDGDPALLAADSVIPFGAQRMKWPDIVGLIVLQLWWFYLGYRYGRWYASGPSVKDVSCRRDK